jgi:hypothetical protein
MVNAYKLVKKQSKDRIYSETYATGDVTLKNPSTSLGQEKLKAKVNSIS